MDEKMDRHRIIKKLKDIKDPAERDRIIWALAGKEKEVMDAKPASIAPRKAAQPPARGQGQKLPQLPVNVRKIFNYIVPGIFIFFGLMNIVQALMHYSITGQIEDAIPKLILGGIFILFGIFGIMKARKQIQSTDADQKET
jgi:hypothetical protein